MLSKHSFNALLKTLEEPPEHVKFLLATTDPQKLPVTVLSRCLQFNLKKLPVDLIVERLKKITQSEAVASDEAGLIRLARAAGGSMRDALSLLDQAIAFGDGAIKDDDVLVMLGSIDRRDVAQLLETLIAGDAAGVMQRVSDMDEYAPDYESALTELASVIQRAALAKAVPEALDDSQGDRELAQALAQSATAEELQLYYQIALIGRRDLYLAANPRGGFEMVLLRMLAFRPAAEGDTLGVVQPVAASSPKSTVSRPKKSSTKAATAKTPKPDSSADVDWGALVEKINVRGAARELAANCLFSRRQGNVWHLTLDTRHEHLHTDQLRERLGKALEKVVGDVVILRIHMGDASDDTPAAKREQATEARMDAARDEIEKDPNVKALKDLFDATVVEDTVRPVDRNDTSGT